MKNQKNNEKRNIILILMGIILLAFGFIGAIYINNYNRDLVYKKSITIKIGDELPSLDSYMSKEEQKCLDGTKIEWDSVNLEDGKIYSAGNYKGYITFRNKKIELVLEVIDDVAPTIDNVNDVTIYVNEEVDLTKNITTRDNSHDEVSLKVNGEYNTSTVGEYNLNYVASDKSGNETTQEFKLIVKEKETSKTTYIPSINTSTSIGGNVTIGKSSKGYTIKRVNGIYYVNDILVANKTYALPSSYSPGGLLNEFMDAFNKMQTDALSEGISLSIISGYRSYDRQNILYNNYAARDGKTAADTYSARAGHSEHQTGLAADINSLNQSWINTNEGQWLHHNCYKYGFIIRYPEGKENITGYMYEPWHIRFVGVDVATTLYNGGNWISLEEYLGINSQYNY